jgi:arylsulfatase A-like enzyme/Tfp pilus assembly protein PilF
VGRRRGRVLAWIALAAALAAAGVVGVRLLGRTGGLGRLTGGVSTSELNLVVVTLDTTRADRLGCYGARDVATPNLDGLAARGALFERAISAMPLTLPAHSSLFTSLEPGAHGVRDNGGFQLGADRTTLAEVLKEHGFDTGGFVAAYVLDHRWGIAQGFDRYYDDFDLSKYKSVSMGDIQRRGDDVIRHGLEWIEQVSSKRFFAWLHLYDPHSPYDAPEPFATQYAGRPYNGEIAWTDSLVGELLAGLERMDLTRKTIVAVIGDHGESLGEHGETGHGYFIYEPSIRVPFILASPYADMRGRRVAEVVRQVDVAPTLLEMLGIPEGLKGQGRSLVPLLLGKDSGRVPEGYSESFYARYHYGWSELRGLRTKRHHFIEAPIPELYDVEADPGETKNLAENEPDLLRSMRAALERLEEEIGPAPDSPAPLEEDEETLRKLASLGYVGSVANTSGKSWRDLPDPKARIEIYNLMNRARDTSVEGDVNDAIVMLREVLAQDPEVIDAWFMLGNSFFKKREWEQAAEYYRKTLEKRPDHDYAMIGLADTLVATGRVDDAVLVYRRFLQQDPDNAQITYRLAQVLLDAQRDAEADEEFVRTLAIEPKTARAEVGRAVAAFRARNVAAARAAIDRALAIDPKAAHARYNLALILESSGDLAGAAREYRAEISDHPNAYKAHFNLGRLLSRMRDLRGAVDSLRRSVAERPDFAIGHLFLAQALLDIEDLDGAVAAAKKGLDLDAGTSFAPLGHYVLADAYTRLGRKADAAEELRRGRTLEARPPRAHADPDHLSGS